MFPLNNVPFLGRAKMNSRGCTHMWTQCLNFLIIWSLQPLALGSFLFLHWIFSPKCCNLPRYYISFVVFTSFPVSYTLRSYSEMPPAGMDLHTNNIVLSWGPVSSGCGCQEGQAQLETTKSFQASSQGGWWLLCSQIDVATSVGTSRAECQISQMNTTAQAVKPGQGWGNRSWTSESVTQVSCSGSLKAHTVL